eukprot:COSAG03_NODE_5579_length_1216_cov_1.088630_2_plen_104_part_01
MSCGASCSTGFERSVVFKPNKISRSCTGRVSLFGVHRPQRLNHLFWMLAAFADRAFSALSHSRSGGSSRCTVSGFDTIRPNMRVRSLQHPLIGRNSASLLCLPA